MKRRFPRIRLRVGIAVVFLSVMLPLTAMMTALLYRQNSQLAYDLAETAMEGATRDVVVGVTTLMGPMARVVNLSVAFGKAEREHLRQVEAMRPLLDTLEAFPDLYSIYFAFATDGAFYQVIRLPPPGSPGLVDRHPPATARYALRIIDTVEGERVESYIYLAKWNEVVGVERATKVTYDPRQRPWYATAEASKDVVSSGTYVFTSVNQPGMTLSQKMATEDGKLLGVFGADLLTTTLSKFLAERAIGKDGVVFILDEEGRLLGYPFPERAMVQHGSKVEIAKADEIADKTVSDAVRLRSAKGDHFRAALGEAGTDYLVSFSRFPESFGKNWTIGVIAAESEFIGPLRRASVIILLIGTGVLLLASIAIVWVSRLLTRPIRALTEETQKIKVLDLSTDVDIRSGVEEVHTLAVALGAMKAALRSFITYVPKDLVQQIINSGTATAIGGDRRQATILFTDLENFTHSSEFLAPEDVATRLSVYLEAMSGGILRHHGIIDKFIGDSIMGLWNAPARDDDHIANACCAVLDCRAIANSLSEEFSANTFPPMPTRFGLHTGSVLVGNVGSRERMQYTALGATVNLASRIEGINKLFGTTALVSGAVEEAVRDRFLLRPLGPVIPAGMSTPVTLFELIATQDAATEQEQAHCRQWCEAFALFRARQWAEAAQAFRDYLDHSPDDRAARLLLDRSIAYAAAPPPADWDGAIAYDGK